MHQSAPNFATSRGAKLFTEQVEKATNGELKIRLHLAGTLQINASNITQAVGENVVQIGDDLFNSGNIAVAGIPRLPMLIQSYEDFAKADAVLKPYIEKAFAQKRLDGACLPHLSAAVRLGPQEACFARRHQRHEAARRAAGARRTGAALRRRLHHHERARGSLGARSRGGRRHFPDVPCPAPRRTEQVHMSMTSLPAWPSPLRWRVGIRDFTFEACSGFTHVTARPVAQPPKAAFVTRLRLGQSPNQTARQLPDLSTTIWVDSASTGDPCLCGAHSVIRGCSAAGETWRPCRTLDMRFADHLLRLGGVRSNLNP
jgi:hypothetical protein